MKRMFILAVACTLLFACNSEKKEDDKKAESTMSDGTDKKTAPSEFADPKYAELGKKMTEQLSSGDMDGWLSNYADNAVFSWSSGDSLAGKEAIAKYWKDRRMNVIDSISMTNHIWLPLKINTSQTAFDVQGVWLLSWYQVSVKYKNGKKLGFWIHIDSHFNANDKIDRTVQYIDMAPIKAALAK